MEQLHVAGYLAIEDVGTAGNSHTKKQQNANAATGCTVCN